MNGRPTIFVLLAGLLLAGCGNRSGLTVQSVAQDQLYAMAPTAAYYQRTAQGGYEVVLVYDPLEHASPRRGGEEIAPAVEPPLRQIVHLRILWRPKRTPQQSERLAANASIDWYLFGMGVEGEPDRLHYQGAGFVTVDTSGNIARILIRQALIRPREAEGRLTDPLGPSQLSGSFIAERNPRRVERVLGQLRPGEADLAASRQDAIHHAGPPPRQPTGP